jgi:uncharacterized protein
MSLALAFVLALSGPEYPKQAGLVNDFAGVLTQEAKSRLQTNLEGLQKAKNFVLVVVTVKSIENQSIEQYTVGLANAWAIGQKGKNNGVVFLIAPSEKALRIENGYGAEGTLTDIESKLIAEDSIIPLFKAGKLAEGIVAGTDALVAKLGGVTIETARAPPETPKKTGIMVLVVVGIIVVIILMCFPGGREFLWIIFNIALQSGGGSSGSKKSSGGGGSSSSGGGSFGGGGASSKW